MVTATSSASKRSFPPPAVDGGLLADVARPPPPPPPKVPTKIPSPLWCRWCLCEGNSEGGPRMDLLLMAVAPAALRSCGSRRRCWEEPPPPPPWRRAAAPASTALVGGPSDAIEAKEPVAREGSVIFVTFSDIWMTKLSQCVN